MRQKNFIPFNIPYVGKDEIEEALKAISSGEICGRGPITKIVENKICKLIKTNYALLTTSGTHALELAVMALDITQGDEVICPSFTFVSTANAILRQSAKPAFVDIELDTLNLNIKEALAKITKKTKAIIPVHYAGISCDLDELRQISNNKFYIIEDAAQAFGAKYKDKFLGTVGTIGSFSFHSTKNITSGEGGAFVTDNKKLAKKAEIIIEKGTNRLAFLKGEVDKYTWQSIGSSFVLSDILASILNAQLAKLKKIIQSRKKIFESYLLGLKKFEIQGKIRVPKIPKFNTPNYHIFYFLVDKKSRRDKLLTYLKAKGISATFHYIPLHSSPYWRNQLKFNNQSLPNTEIASNTLIRLPIYPSLTKQEIEYILDWLNKGIKYVY